MTNQEIAEIMTDALADFTNALEDLRQTGSDEARARVLALRWRLKTVSQGLDELQMSADEDRQQRVA